MNKLTEQIISYLKKINTLLSLFFLFLAKYILPVFLLLIQTLFTGEVNATTKPLDFNLFYEELLGVTIFAPLLETAIFLSFLFWLLFKIKYLRTHRWIAILLSAITFGLTHLYSPTYAFMTIIIGIIFAIGYIAYCEKYNRKIAFLLIFVLHGLGNLISYLSMYFDQ